MHVNVRPATDDGLDVWCKASMPWVLGERGNADKEMQLMVASSGREYLPLVYLRKAGVLKAGVLKAGVLKAGVVNAGVLKAGVLKAGVVDAGVPARGQRDAYPAQLHHRAAAPARTGREPSRDPTLSRPARPSQDALTRTARAAHPTSDGQRCKHTVVAWPEEEESRQTGGQRHTFCTALNPGRVTCPQPETPHPHDRHRITSLPSQATASLCDETGRLEGLCLDRVRARSAFTCEAVTPTRPDDSVFILDSSPSPRLHTRDMT
ncbi:hypothetical protein VDGL01_06311 [Verticillium dahliae]